MYNEGELMPPDNDKFKDRFDALRNVYILGTAGVQVVISVLIGLGMGLALDRWLGTAPWFMLLFIIFGTAAGFLNVYRIATKDDEAFRDDGKSGPPGGRPPE